jgi:hypothetical protein
MFRLKKNKQHHQNIFSNNILLLEKIHTIDQRIDEIRQAYMASIIYTFSEFVFF